MSNLANSPHIDTPQHHIEDTINIDNAAAQTASVAEIKDEEMLFKLLILAPELPNSAKVEPFRLDNISAGDTVLSLRQLIMDHPPLSFYTAYHIEVENNEKQQWIKLNDYVELGEYDVINKACSGDATVTVRMVLEKYDVRKVRSHIKRFREVLANPPVTKQSIENSAATQDANEQSSTIATSDAVVYGQSESKDDALDAEQQLLKLRKIHEKLDGIQIPVEMRLSEFYSSDILSSSDSDELNNETGANGNNSSIKKSKAGKKKDKKQKDKEKQQKSESEPSSSSPPKDKSIGMNLPQCLNSILYSGFNPPNAPQKLAGDLCYLVITTLNEDVYHVTAHVDGFFLNCTSGSNFSQIPDKKWSTTYHLLVDLLRAISTDFTTRYTTLLKRANELTGASFEEALLTSATPQSQDGGIVSASALTKLAWLAPSIGKNAPLVSYDANRAEDELMCSFGLEDRGVLRDWNEELQCCKELPNSTEQERIVRSRVFYKIMSEFVEAATIGAVAILDGHVSPLNPMDEAAAHVYVFNNIFYSLSIDGKKPSTLTSSTSSTSTQNDEEAAFSSANRDLQGVKAFNDVDVPGLHTLATAVIDYLGLRIIAQSVIPGILQGEASSKLIYGSVDNGKTIATNEKMHALMLQAGSRLHIAERQIKPLGTSETSGGDALNSVNDNKCCATTKVVKICGPVEAKGILGSDERMYVLDLVRITPKDATFYFGRDADRAPADEEESWTFKRDANDGYVAVLRPELIQLYALWREAQHKAKLRRDVQVKKQNDPNSNESEDTNDDAEIDEGAKASPDEIPKGDDTALPNEAHDLPPLQINPNVYMDYAPSTDPEQARADENEAKEVAEYLQSIVIPAFLADIRRGAIAPADGYALSELMHSCGINMRYLGRLAYLSKKLEEVGGISKFLLELLEVEMIARVVKHLVAHLLNVNEEVRSAPGKALIQILNEIFSIGMTKKNNAEENAWDQIEREISSRFSYTLSLWTNASRNIPYPNNDKTSPNNVRVHKYVLLRRICQRLGLRLHAREYDFNQSSNVFSIDDIATVFPVVKTSLPSHPSTHAKQLLEQGRLLLSRGSLANAYEMLSEASTILFQVCGANHEDVALASSSLATVLYHAGDVQGAILQQQRALALYAQLCGLDFHDTAYAHANLALFFHSDAQTDRAVKHIRRAIYLLEFCSGPHFPEISALYFKMGVMCQDVGQITLALLCHRESLRRGEFDRVQAANTLHQMALACSLAGGYREALAYEKKVYSILNELYGENHERVIESAKFMSKFTEKAVEGAKGRREIDAAAQADAIAKELLDELQSMQIANDVKKEGEKKIGSKSKKNRKH